MVDYKTLNMIQSDLTAGRKWAGRQRDLDDTPEIKETWDALEAELADMAARGVLPDFPKELGDDEDRWVI